MIKMKETLNVKVKGTSFRQNFLQFARKCDKFWCECRRQKNNAADPNAIIVWAVCVYKGAIKTVPVGYIPKELAAELAPVMDNGAKLYCNTAHITGGTNKYLCGLNIAVTPYMPAAK